MKFKVPVNLKFTVAERCHYYHATRSHQLRAAKGKRPARESVEAKGEIIVQRMSSEVTGKQQKYTRIGPREFVPFVFYEITFDNIVEACQKYFAVQIDKDMVCDILAGERGPSCKKMCQIPDHKVRFIGCRNKGFFCSVVGKI